MYTCDRCKEYVEFYAFACYICQETVCKWCEGSTYRECVDKTDLDYNPPVECNPCVLALDKDGMIHPLILRELQK